MGRIPAGADSFERRSTTHATDPGRREGERRLKYFRFVPAVILAAHGAAATPAFAQDVPGSDGEAGALLESGVRFTSVGERTEPLLVGFVMLTIGSRVALGGGGAILARSVDVGGDPIYPDRRLGFGYGGLTAEVVGPSPGSVVDLGLRVLVGAGNVDLTDNATGTRIESDNVFVVEPEVLVRRRLTSWLRVSVSSSFRFTSGVDRIDTDAVGNLESFAVGLGLSIGPL